MKKVVKLNGRLLGTLKEGNCAIISCDVGIIKTSSVVNINKVTETLACFETMNSVYNVILVAESIAAPLPICA